MCVYIYIYIEREREREASARNLEQEAIIDELQQRIRSLEKL